MADEDRKRIIDRANRLLRQSKTLRKLSDELLDESHDLRVSVRRLTRANRAPRARRRR
jgi:CHAD domain-containing protein